MIPEMTPTTANSLVSSSSTALNVAIAFIMTKFFDQFQFAVTRHGAFLTFCVICIASIAFVFLLPETKGRTIEEISRSFRGEREVLSRNSIPLNELPDRKTTYVL